MAVAGEHPRAETARARRPRALLIMGRLQVGVLWLCALVLLGGILVRWSFSGGAWPAGSVVALLVGLGAVLLGGVWLAATRPAWTGRIGPLITVAAVTVPVAAGAGLWLAVRGVPGVPFAAVVLPVGILVVWVRQRGAH